MKKFPAVYILITYVLTLGLVALLSDRYPVEVASAIQRVSSQEIDLSMHDHARHRIALFLSATALLVVLFPFVWHLGARIPARIPHQSPTWGKTFAVIILIPLIWVSYLFVGTCTTLLVEQ
jgi:hypothetical protein